VRRDALLWREVRRRAARWGKIGVRDRNPKCLLLYMTVVMGLLGLFGPQRFFWRRAF
jgi:hypothetical protein